VYNSSKSDYIVSSTFFFRTILKIERNKHEDFSCDENSTVERVTNLEKGTHKLFKIVSERLNIFEDLVVSKLPPNRKKIGLRHDKKY
jgi:hypothetical protein